MQTRRTFLNNALLIAGTAIAESQHAFAASGGSVDPATLSAKLTLPDGTVKTFSGAQGKDLGDFTVQFANIVQRNVMTRDSSGLFSVFFRPDRNSSRVEVVVLYGDPFNDAPKTLGPYTFEIFISGRQLQKIEVPYHFWLARWRWQSSVRPIVRKPAELVAAGLSVSYGVTSITQKALPRAAAPYTIMGISDTPAFIDQTGEGSYIGQNPDVMSAWMATEDETAAQSMRDWAEASATGPWHLNDPKRQGPINWDDYPLASTASGKFHQPPILVMLQSERDENKKFIYPDFIRPGDAHHPCYAYIPFVATGDPFLAEELQYQINFYLGGEHNTKGAKTYIFDQAQTRGYAWMMRSVVDNILASDLVQSPVLLPKTFWRKILDNNLAWITKNFVNDASTKAAYFSSGTSKTVLGWWQEDYLLGVLGSMVQLGFTEWIPVLQWKAKTDINRLNGTSGWNPDHPTIYYAQYVKQDQRPGPNNAGNGTIQFIPLSERGAQYPYLGEWQLQFTDPNEFNIIAPGGMPPSGSVRTGTVGKKVGSGYVPAFQINAGDRPFAAGDVLYWTISKITDWKTLWDVNLAMGAVRQPVPGVLDDSVGAYIQHLYAAVTLAAPNVPELAALRPGLMAKMLAGKSQVSWRDSFTIPTGQS